MFYYNDMPYETEAEMLAQIMIDHPELGDDALCDFVQNNTWED